MRASNTTLRAKANDVIKSSAKSGRPSGRRSSRIAKIRSASSQSAARAGKNDADTAPKLLTAEQLDELHDAGVDMTPYIDYDKGIRPGRAVQRVNVDFPTDLLRAIDREATRIGVARQAWIKLRLADYVGKLTQLDAVGTTSGKATVAR
jgi:hypothetical protein